ncbi:transposase [Nonomuraea sp. NBC_00507]|uniref:transposase n=1 Tax=Nonomuraea sp. NBC_00507 TaxID=2976002 RepID=UPI002E19ED72
MSVQACPWPEPSPQVAEAIRVMYRGRREVPLPVRVRDELGELFADEQFAAAFGTEGRPGWSPGRLALITVLQRVEDLTDRRAAEAVRTDLSWKYALGLELDDSGFDASVLSEFRSRVIAHGLEERVLDLLLEALKDKGLVKEGGKQRTDATHVVSVVRDLNRVELAGECVRAALEALVAAAPGWVEQVLEVTDWADRYRARIDSWRLPASKTKQEQLARAYGADGYALCAAVYAPFSPSWLRELASGADPAGDADPELRPDRRCPRTGGGRTAAAPARRRSGAAARQTPAGLSLMIQTPAGRPRPTCSGTATKSISAKPAAPAGTARRAHRRI